MADVMPVMVITGARQVGKSTMLKNEFADYSYTNTSFFPGQPIFT